MYIGKIQTGRSYKKIILFFVVISCALVIFVIYNSFSKAKIILTPKQEPEKIEMSVIIEQKSENLSQFNVLSGRILEKILDTTQKITDIAKKDVEDKAQGKVVIYNKRGKAQPLLPHTQLRSEKTGLIFRTDQRVVVPARGQVEVSVTSDEIGEKTNIEPDRFIIVKIWKDWQNLIYAESKEKMTGGIRNVKVATQEEIDKARDKVAEDLFQKALLEFKNELQGDEKILKKATIKEILASKANVKPDTRTDEFDMTVKLKVTAVIFNEQALLDLALSQLKGKIPEGKEYVSYNPESFNYFVENYDLKNGRAQIRVFLEGTSVNKLSSKAFDKEKLIGRNVQEVELYFKRNSDIEKVKVSFSPFWVKSVPSLKDHIEIIVEK